MRAFCCRCLICGATTPWAVKEAGWECASMGTIAEMRKVCQVKRRTPSGKMRFIGTWYDVYCTRYYSIYITWFFVKLGVSADAVTGLMALAGVAGPLLIIPHSLWLNLIGVFCLVAHTVLDCVDGEVARYNKVSSPRGIFLDHASHVLSWPLYILAPCVHLVLWGAEPVYFWLMLLAGYSFTVSYGVGKESRWETLRVQVKRGSLDPAMFREAYADEPAPTVRRGLVTKLKCAYGFAFFQATVFLTQAGCVMLSHLVGRWPLKAFAWFYAVGGLAHALAKLVFAYRRMPKPQAMEDNAAENASTPDTAAP